MNRDLKRIKKAYGENMMHLCRELFPTILEMEGRLPSILLEHFDKNHMLYDDIIKNNLRSSFQIYIYSFTELGMVPDLVGIQKTPKQLLDEVGYHLYECKTEEEIQKFKTYYKESEALCTFKTHRLLQCHVFFAVKKDALQIRREDFEFPDRQDRYGTSVISIQFTKDALQGLSIKNRYNDTVDKPDSTFANNLDNIVDGLTVAFEKEYGLKQKELNISFSIPGYIKASDGKFYKYNYKMYNTYYCVNNVIIDSQSDADSSFTIHKYDKERYIVMDYFILDFKEKSIFLFDEAINENFQETIGNVSKITRKKHGEETEIRIQKTDNKELLLVLSKENRIVKITDNHIEDIGDYYCSNCEYIEEINMMNLKRIGNECFFQDKKLVKANILQVESIGDNCFTNSKILTKLNVANLKEVRNYFLLNNECLKEFIAPSLVSIGDFFLAYNYALKELDLPSVKEIGDYFLYSNQVLEKLNISCLDHAGISFLNHHMIAKIYCTWKQIQEYCLENNGMIQSNMARKI